MNKQASCWCGSEKKWKRCHFPFENYPQVKARYKDKYGIIIKTDKQVEKIRIASKITAKILDQLVQEVEVGMTTLELDQISMDLHKKHGAIPGCLGYGSPPFPASICTSINEVICHGIPDKRVLKSGDILNIDVTSKVDGYFGDTSRMVVLGGKTTADRQLVTDVSYNCLHRAISKLHPMMQIKDIAVEIEAEARRNGCSVVYAFVGHGVGLQLHEPPHICHNYNNNKIKLMPNMIFTIEPMINYGKPDAVEESDGWTYCTIDNKPSAQWEHTILITEDGYEILTLP